MNEIKIGVNGVAYRLTDLNNGNKYTRAQVEAGEGANIEKVLAYYDRLGGNIQDKNYQKVENGKFWSAEKARLENEKSELKDKSDKELEVIVRRGENMNVPGSLFQFAKVELELRDRKLLTKHHAIAKKWWERTSIQVIMLLGAISGILGLLLVI